MIFITVNQRYQIIHSIDVRIQQITLFQAPRKLSQVSKWCEFSTPTASSDVKILHILTKVKTELR